MAAYFGNRGLELEPELLRLILLAVAGLALLRLGGLIGFVVVTRHGIGKNAVDMEVLREFVQDNQLFEVDIANRAVQRVLLEDRVRHNLNIVSKGKGSSRPSGSILNGAALTIPEFEAP